MNRRQALGLLMVWLAFSLQPSHAGEPVVVTTQLSDNGDDDGFADSNETVELRMLARNPGPDDLTGVVARLRTEDPGLACIVSAVAAIGDLAAGEERWAAPFVVRIADVERSGTCSGSGGPCLDDFDCGPDGPCLTDSPAAVAPGSPGLTARFDVAFSSDQFPVPSELDSIELDLDLDVSGGAGPGSFFEGFEVPTGLASFTAMNIDAPLHGDFVAADGYRCQYNDVDFTNSNSYGAITDCFPGATPAQADAFFWQIDGPGSLDGGRAFEGTRSLYMGIPLDPSLGHTTPMAVLEAVRSEQPIDLGWDRICSDSRNVGCVSDVDCPVDESCGPARPTLSFKQQISLMDSRTVSAPGGESADAGVVEIQLADATGAAVSDWIKVYPNRNRYDQQRTDNYTNCMFDPVDDGNNEEDFFDPSDPFRRLGPSSTCYPEFSFVHLGDTDMPYDPLELGGAEAGSGLPGGSGPGTWVESSFDLSRYRGRKVRLRFLNSAIKAGTFGDYEQIFAHNPDPGDDGWWIDGLEVSDTLTAGATVQVDLADNSGLPGDLSDGDGDGIFDVCDNCAGDSNAGQEDQDGDLAGDLCDPCPLEFVDDADGDGLCCPDDNCCAEFNADQADGDGDGVGDPCDLNPVFLVSDDFEDEPDFFSVSAAVNAASQSGTRIRILPGEFPYAGAVIDKDMLFHFEGVDDGSGMPVIIEGLDAALDLRSTSGSGRMTVKNLTLRGPNALRATVSTEVEDCIFDSSSITAVDLLAGDHLLRRVEILGPAVTRGIWARDGASAEVRDSRTSALTGRGIRAGGAVEVVNSLIADSLDGIFVGDTGSLLLRHSTVAGNDARGVDAASGGPVTVAHSILWGNSTDAVGVDCADVTWSITGSPDCGAVNDNLSTDPLFTVGGGYRLEKNSPALDHGPSPIAWTGDPFTDLDREPRLEDHDGDGLAQIDAGAFERRNDGLSPKAVQDVLWSGSSNMTWSAVLTAVEYHVYRGTLLELGYGYYGDCRDDLDAVRTDLALSDPEEPVAGGGFFYLIAAEDAAGNRGSLGLGTGAERSDFDPCP